MRFSQMRSAELDRAWRIGRNARVRGLDVKAANVDLARQLGWQVRNDFDDALLDECERGWHHEDELRRGPD
jgi:hypothetical protein